MNISNRKPFTPGEILREEFMIPYGLTQGALAKQIDVPRRRVNEIIKGKRSITPDTALRLARLFDMSPEYWLNLQTKLDLWHAVHDKAKRKLINRIRPLKPAVAL